MAVDEVLLRNATGRRLPLLRVYTWVRPAVSFGYFQEFPACLAAKYDSVRRLTGGGVVYHGDEKYATDAWNRKVQRQAVRHKPRRYHS